MDIKKSVIQGQIYDVCSYEQYAKNPQAYDGNTAIVDNGYIYPVKKSNDKGPGMYTAGPRATMVVFEGPNSDEEREIYSDKHLIDFNGDMRQIIESTEVLYEKEKEILTNVNNIFEPRVKDNDSPAMEALKEAVSGKQIDWDSYKHRYGKNANNTKKLFEANDVTLKKVGYVADGMDLKVTLTIEDKSPDVANPLGKKIVKVITGGGNE